MSHSSCRHWNHINSRLLVVGSQTANLIPGPSFAHNLGYRRPNGSCEAILDIYTSRTFQWHQEQPNASFFDLYNRALSFWESRRILTSHFWEWEFHPHTYPKVGLQHLLCQYQDDSYRHTSISTAFTFMNPSRQAYYKCLGFQTCIHLSSYESLTSYF
jgi:hypothetical protein